MLRIIELLFFELVKMLVSTSQGWQIQKWDAHSSIYERVQVNWRAYIPVVLGHERFAGTETHQVDMNY
jgi:hypothetical protein